MGYHTSPSEIYFFDYNSSSDSWTQRASTVTDPDTTLANWFNDGSQIALSEETNGQITLITTNGKTYSLPVNPPTP
ncbi:MAG: hypothetical protein CMD28_04840 [Flavobacteriales bacterium]|nr:hypothetical protein [Flavobacteriales bacterium]